MTTERGQGLVEGMILFGLIAVIIIVILAICGPAVDTVMQGIDGKCDLAVQATEVASDLCSALR